jgi:hypothetical protein
MTVARALATIAAAGGCALLGAAAPAPTLAPPWMTEEAMRAAFIGKTLDGYYGSGVTWTETYLASGRLDYAERERQAGGSWHFRDGYVFCTFYDPSHRPGLVGGCWNALQTGPNCYEFYLAGVAPSDIEEGRPGQWALAWNARAWRREAPSTCREKPSV